MVGDNEAVQPVKGDVRRYIEGGYKPVGATSGQVLTQGPDYDGMNRGFWMGLDAFNSRGRSGGSGKQDYSGQYQVEMNDIASNPAFHNANGTYNSKGNEAIRALNQKYAPYVSGAEIRATESYVGGGYKESVDSALRESFIKQQTADYEAQNKRFVEMYDAAHPENVNAPYETRARLGRRLSDQAGEFMDLTNTLRNNKIESITDPAKRRMAQILMDRMNPDQLDRFINSGDTVKDQQELTDSIASLAVQLGSTPQEAMVMATDASRGVFAHLNKYKNDIQQLSEEELKFMKSHDADETYIDLSPEDKAFYALTGQFSPNTMAQGLAGNISVSDAFKTTKVGDTYKRKLITSDKNVLNFALNNGNSLTASAALNNIVPQMQEELNKGNSAPLRMLNRLPSMANIVNEPNTDPETIKFLEDAIATDIVRNSRHYYKGDNRITDEMDYQNRAAVELAQFLGFSNEKTKDIVNKALTTMGLKQVNGVYTPDELVGAMSANEIMPWATEGVGKQQPQGKDVNDYLSDENKMTVAPTEEQPQVVNDEANQMSRINVYETPEYQEFRSKIVKAVKNKQMTREQGINEDNQFLSRAKEALARVASEFGVKSAEAAVSPVPVRKPNIVSDTERQQSIEAIKDKYNSSDKRAEAIVNDSSKRYSNGRLAKAAIPLTLNMVGPERARDILAYVLHDECRGETKEGQDAVASVMCNRIGTNRGEDILAVVTKAGQFSGLNKMSNKDLFNFVPKTKIDQRFYDIADQLINGTFVPTTDATSYYNPQHQSNASKGWTSKLTDTVKIGNHIFGKDKTIIKQS